jgi:hypothetical protein
MGMSDCVNCWETPCSCGLYYFGSTKGEIKEQIKILQNILEIREEMGVERFTFQERCWMEGDRIKEAMKRLNEKMK